MSLTIDSITFGKYKDKTLTDVLRDRDYCKWLVKQEWFEKDHPYLYSKVQSYDPLSFFITENETNEADFLQTYKFFQLKESPDIELTANEIICYNFYRNQIQLLKRKITTRSGEDNPMDIKAPTKWLKQFETETELNRTELKTFLATFDLPNITSIVEDIKAAGGLEYKGAKAYLIAMSNSKTQEAFWEEKLKSLMNDRVSCQFKYKDCIFDFINIENKTIYECKLGLKDFNKEQAAKYALALDEFKIVYLIGTDCVIDTYTKEIRTTNPLEYILYQCDIPLKTNATEFDELIYDFEIIPCGTVEDCL